MGGDNDISFSSLKQRLGELQGNRMVPAQKNHAQKVRELLLDIKDFASIDVTRSAELCLKIFDISGDRTKNIFPDILAVSMIILENEDCEIRAKENLFQRIIGDRRFDWRAKPDIMIDGMIYLEVSPRASFFVGECLSKSLSDKRMEKVFDSAAFGKIDIVMDRFVKLCQRTVDVYKSEKSKAGLESFAKTIDGWCKLSSHIDGNANLRNLRQNIAIGFTFPAHDKI